MKIEGNKLFVSYTMSNFEAIYYVFEAPDSEEANRIVYNTNLEGIKIEEEAGAEMPYEMLDKLKFIGIEISAYAFVHRVFNRAYKAVNRYWDIKMGAVKKVDPMLKGYVDAIYGKMTPSYFSQMMEDGKHILQHLDEYTNPERENGLDVISPLVDKYMDIFLLKHWSAEYSFEVNVALEKKFSGKGIGHDLSKKHK